MAEEFAFFDPVEIAPDVFDREYNARQFIAYFMALVTTGIMKSEGGQLKVTANGANMIIAIDTGVAFVEGHYYRNTASLPHTLDTESLGRSRIDRIVVRLDMAERKVTSFVKKGVPSTSPVAPVLTQTANLYEIALAQVKVIGGQTYLNVADVVDERGKDVICPWAGSNILPNFDDAALQKLIDSQLTDGPYSIELPRFGSLNDVVETGFYHGVGNVGFPTNGAYFIQVLARPEGASPQIYLATVTQIAYPTDGIGSSISIRNGTFQGGSTWVWSSWDKLPSRKQENWIDIVLQSGVADVGINKPAYYKDNFGVVHVAGTIRGTFIAFQMPVGYRPQKAMVARYTLSNMNQPNGLSVQTNGYFVASTPQDNFYTFNFSYRAEE